MAPEATLSKVYQWALVIDEQELRRLADECRRSIVEGTNAAPESVLPELEVRFSDGLSYTPETLDDVLAEENPRGRSISGLQLRAYTKGAGILCRFALEHQGASSVTVTSSDRQWVYVTLSRIEERLRRMKQWHPRVRNLIVPMLFVTGALWVGVFAIVANRFPELVPAQSEHGSLIVGLLMLGLVVSMLGVVFTAGALFPDPVFRIGDGLVRHDRAKSARSKLLWALIAACILTPIVRGLSGLIW